MKGRVTSTYLKWIASAAFISMVACSAQTKPVESIQSASTNDTSNKSFTELSSDIFTIEDKYTKTIETPWGGKQVYDPTKVPEIREDFRIWYNHPELISYVEHRRQMYESYEKNSQKKQQIIQDATRIQALDYARHQCMRQFRFEGCVEEDFVFKKPCLEDQNLNLKNLSVCETESYTKLWPSSIRCDIVVKTQTYDENLLSLPFEEALDSYYDRECTVWRGQAGDDFWENELFVPGVLNRYR